MHQLNMRASDLIIELYSLIEDMGDDVEVSEYWVKMTLSSGVLLYPNEKFVMQPLKLVGGIDVDAGAGVSD